MLWLALYLPHLGLETQGCLTPQLQPRVLAQRQGDRLTVLDADSRAIAAGIVSGMSVSGASLLAPGLAILERNRQAERRCLQGLGWWALQFTPRVVLLDDGLLLEIGGSCALFGGWQSITQQVKQGMAALGHRPVQALAPTPLAAEWLARADAGHCLEKEDLQAALCPVPLAVMGLEPSLLSQLSGMGLHRVGQLLALPRASVGRRCGPALGILLDRALGRRADPRKTVPAPARFVAELDLPAEASRVSALKFALWRMVQELCGFLRSRDAGARAVSLTLVQGRSQSQSLSLTLTRPGADPAHWLALWDERLQRLTLQAPVQALILRCEHWARPEPSSSDLFGHDRQAMAERCWLELLQARLGDEAVKAVALRADGGRRGADAGRATRPPAAVAVGRTAGPGRE